MSVDGENVTVSFTRSCSFADLDDIRGAVPVVALLKSAPPGDALFDADGREVADSAVNERYIFIPAPGKHAGGETLKFRIGQRPAVNAGGRRK